MNRKDFMDIHDILSCRVRNISVMLELRRPHYWSLGAEGHVIMYPEKNTIPNIFSSIRGTIITQNSKEVVETERPDQKPTKSIEWTEVVSGANKVADAPPLQDVQTEKEVGKTAAALAIRSAAVAVSKRATPAAKSAYAPAATSKGAEAAAAARTAAGREEVEDDVKANKKEKKSGRNRAE